MMLKKLLFGFVLIVLVNIFTYAQDPSCTGYKFTCNDEYFPELGYHNSPLGPFAGENTYTLKIRRNGGLYFGQNGSNIGIDQIAAELDKTNLRICVQVGTMTITTGGRPPKPTGCSELMWDSFGTMFCDENGNVISETPSNSLRSFFSIGKPEPDLYFTIVLGDFPGGDIISFDNAIIRIIVGELNDSKTDFKNGYLFDETFCITDNWFSDMSWEPVADLGPGVPADLTLTATDLFESEESSEETPELLDFLLYPNPVEKGNSVLLTLNCPEDSLSGVLVEIYDHTGKCVLKKDAEGREVSIDGLKASGIYFIRVISPEGISKTKRVQVK